MWNQHMIKGAIWVTKSRNEFENEFYEGMTFGPTWILILSAFLNENNNRKFTYLKILNYKRPDKHYIEINIDSKPRYIEIDNIYTGEQKALNHLIYILDTDTINLIIEDIKNYYSLTPIKKSNINKEIINESNPDEESIQQRIFKFGINIFVTENEHVKISKTKKIILSKEAREDIILNSQTDEDIRNLSDKYKIYPVKAIREIKNRLVYQHKQKEG